MIGFLKQVIMTSAMLLCTLAINAIDETRTFNVINASNGLIDNSAQTILCTQSGRIIVTTIGHINIYDGTKFSHFDSESGGLYTLANYNGNYHLYFDKHRRLWLKNKQTVTCVDLMTEKCVADIGNIFRAEGVTRVVDDMFVDSDGELWLVSDGKLYGKSGSVIIDLPVGHELQDFDVAADRACCFYSNGEVFAFSLKSSELLYSSNAYDVDVVPGYDRTSVIKRYGDKIFQIRNGVKGAVLMWLDAASGYWTHIKTLDYKMNNMAINRDNLYIASAYGYWIYDIETSEMQHFEMLKMVDGSELLTDINTIQFDNQDGMWIGTEKRGLLYSQPLPSPFKALSWNSPLASKYAIMMDTMDILETTAYGKNVNCAYKDSRGWTWVGTYSGLKIYKPQGGTPVVLTKHDGLMNEVIHSIVEDKNKHMWVSTSHGISCIVMRGDSVLNINSYLEEDNIPTETFLLGKALVVDSSGTIAMQAIDHVLAFNPNLTTLIDNPYVLTPQLVKLSVNGNEVAAGTEIEGDVLLDKAVYITRELNLNYNQNTVELTFSALNYFRPIQTYYKVRVSDVHDEWQVLSYFNSDGLVDRNGLLHLPLTGLAPGLYKIEVMASMYPYSWKGEPLVFTINVNEPWWRTRILYLFVVAVLIALVVGNVIYYNRNYRMRVKYNNEERDVIKRIRNFIDRCESFKGEILSPRSSVAGLDDVDEKTDVNKEFVNMILKLMPLLTIDQEPTARSLIKRSGLSSEEFYKLISENIYKNPRLLVLSMRLENASDLLVKTEKQIGEIAQECGFLTVEFFADAFARQYGMQPNEYRTSFKD